MMEEKTAAFQMEMDVNEAYLRETWDVYPKVRRITRLLALLPVVGLLAVGFNWAATGEAPWAF